MFKDDPTWQLWLIFDPKKAVMGLAVGLFVLAVFIHSVLLGTSRFNWLSSHLAPPYPVQALPAAVH